MFCLIDISQQKTEQSLIHCLFKLITNLYICKQSVTAHVPFYFIQIKHKDIFVDFDCSTNNPTLDGLLVNDTQNLNEM